MMKPALHLFAFLALAMFSISTLSSCNRQPTSCIYVEEKIIGIGDTLILENCSDRGKSFEWNLGDGTITRSNTENTVTHVYGSTGTYTVELCAYSRKEDKSSCSSVNIQVVNFAYADFTMDSTSCVNPCPVQFTNTSLHADTYFWDFGDSSTSREENPSHTYNSSDIFTVTLTASNQYGSSSFSQEINVIDPYPPTAVFTSELIGNFSPLGVQFNNLSKNGTTYEWNFGDGFSSFETSPYHVYEGSGSYLVTLKATNPFGEDSYTDFISVAPQPNSLKIVEMELINFNPTDGNGIGWDVDCDNSPADAYFTISDANNILFASTGFNDITNFPVWYQNSTGFPFTISPVNQQYYIGLWDADGPGCAPDELITEFAFTPANLMPTDGSAYPETITFDDGNGMVFTAHVEWN